MEPRPGMTLTLEGVPGEFIRNRNIEGDPAKSNRGFATRSFTIRLTPEYVQLLEANGFPIGYPQDTTNEPMPYLAVVLFPEAKYRYPASVVVMDTGHTRKQLDVSKWREFDERPIEYVDVELETYLNKNGAVRVKAPILYFHTKYSILREKYIDISDPDVEPAP